MSTVSPFTSNPSAFPSARSFAKAATTFSTSLDVTLSESFVLLATTDNPPRIAFVLLIVESVLLSRSIPSPRRSGIVSMSMGPELSSAVFARILLVSLLCKPNCTTICLLAKVNCSPNFALLSFSFAIYWNRAAANRLKGVRFIPVFTLGFAGSFTIIVSEAEPVQLNSELLASSCILELEPGVTITHTGLPVL